MSFIKRHRVAVFFVLAYVLTWWAVPWNSFFVPGVLLAALIVVTVTEGLAGLRKLGSRLIRWRVSWVWYALAIGVPLAVHLASGAINVGLGAPMPSLGLLSPWYSILLAIGLHAIDPTGGPVMEEPSFRGFAQPELQVRHSPMTATAIMAVLVAGWHLPLFFMPVFNAHPIGIVTTMAVTFWYAWLFNHASGSSLLTLIAHGAEGAVLTNSPVGGRRGSGAAQLPVRHRVVHRGACPAGLRPAFWTRRPPVYAEPAAKAVILDQGSAPIRR
jgi:membrane protease YdiL (CAAX protease family)